MITKVLSKVIGLLLVLLGLWWCLMILAFASLIDPSLQGDAWWERYWDGMANRGGWGGLGFGLAMAACGAWLLVVPAAPEAEPRPKRVDKMTDTGIH